MVSGTDADTSVHRVSMSPVVRAPGSCRARCRAAPRRPRARSRSRSVHRSRGRRTAGTPAARRCSAASRRRWGSRRGDLAVGADAGVLVVARGPGRGRRRISQQQVCRLPFAFRTSRLSEMRATTLPSRVVTAPSLRRRAARRSARSRVVASGIQPLVRGHHHAVDLAGRVARDRPVLDDVAPDPLGIALERIAEAAGRGPDHRVHVGRVLEEVLLPEAELLGRARDLGDVARSARAARTAPGCRCRA